MLTDLWVMLALIGSGLMTGLAAGLFGIGGGTVLIPLLLTVFSQANIPHDVVMHVAVATSLALIIPTALASTIGHCSKQNMDWQFAKRWIPGICIGVIFGVILIHSMSTHWLKLLFATYLLFCIGYSLFTQESMEDNLAGPPRVATCILSLFVGFFSTLLGVGGGTFTTPILEFYHYPLKRAIAISAFTGLFIGGIGAGVIVMTSVHIPELPPHSLGYVNWLVFILIAPTAIIGSPLGVLWEQKLSAKTLSRAYTGFLITVFMLMVYHLLRSG